MEPKSRFQSIGLNDGVIANTLKNKNLTNRLLDVLTKANVPESGCPKEKGKTLNHLRELVLFCGFKGPHYI